MHFSDSTFLPSSPPLFGPVRCSFGFRISFGLRVSDFGFLLPWLSTFLLFTCVRPALAAETIASSNQVLHATSASVAERLASFRLASGFKIQLVATEPMVSAPVTIAFDENGRLFVAEMRDYPGRGNARPHLGRVRVLTDPDSEGVYQTSTVYAEDLRWPSALACYAGGLFVLATPDLYYFRDTGLNGTADLKRLVLTGFGGTNTLNPDFLPNSLTWGLDDRFHGVSAGIDGTLTASNWPSGVISLAGSDFAFAPRSLEALRETGPAQSGLTFNDAGRRFVSDHVRPLRLPMYEVHYTDRNPFYAKPAPFLDVASPASPVISGSTNHTGTAWLANVRGTLIYRGRAFPTNYYGNAFIPDPDAHVVQRLALRENGMTVIAERTPQQQKGEFLISSDPSFRPVQAVNGPDGALYVVDMQNGEDRGRIYKIVPTNFKPPKAPELAKARTYDLVAALAGSDGWYCDTAERLLYERHDPVAVPLLSNMLSNSRLPLARLRALHALGGVHAFTEPDVVKSFSDADPRVREQGVRLAEQLITNGIVSASLWSALKGLTADPALAVRYQLAFTVGETAQPDKALVLAQILRRDLNDSWIRNAVLSSLSSGAGNLFLLLAGDVRFRNDPAGHEFLRQLAVMIGTAGRLDEVRQLVALLAQTQLDRLQMFGFAAGLCEGLHYTRSSLSAVDPQGTLQQFYAGAFQTAIDSFTPPAARIEAIRFVAAGPGTFPDTSDWLLALCNPQPSGELRVAAIAALARYDHPGVVTGLLDRWPVFPFALRTYAISAMLMRRSHVPLVAEALARGRIAQTDFSPPQLDFLRTYDEPIVSDRVEQLVGPLKLRRPTVVEQFKQAPQLPGDPAQGRATFVARCAGCHRLEGVGSDFGPDLAVAKVKGKEKLLSDILEPSANIELGYETCVLHTFEGENLIGIKVDENSTTVTLRQPRGESIVCPRLNMQALRPQTWSLMPAGLEQGLSSQDLANLLEYLMTVSAQPSPARP
jgi:putative membrane-bound dehydrogenase-like protein